jgi:hypothetical protein
MKHRPNASRIHAEDHRFQILVASPLSSAQIRALMIEAIPSSTLERGAVVVGTVVIQVEENSMRYEPPRPSDLLQWHLFEHEISAFGLDDSAIEPLHELPRTIVQILEATGARCEVFLDYEDDADAAGA